MNLPTSTQQVAINTRTLRIGHQTYQLQNLARVQILPLRQPLDAGKGNSALAWTAAVAAFVVVVIPISSVLNSGTLGFLGFFGSIALGVLVYLKTRKFYEPLFALMLETTGNPQTALVSPDQDELGRLSREIVGAIENPPVDERLIAVHNVILGDQYNQSGYGNIGKIGVQQ